MLFVRPSSGLTKAITMKTGWAVAIASMMLPYLYSLVPIMPNVFPGVSIGLSFAIAGFFVFVEAFAAALLLCAMPRSGGMYVTVARGLGPIFGMMELWRSGLNTAVLTGLSAYLMIQSIGSSFSVVGTLIKDPGYASIGTWMSTVVVAAALAIVVLALIHALHYFGPHLDAIIMTTFMVVVIVALLIMIGLFASTTPAMLQGKWDVVFGAGSYNSIVEAGTKAGWKPVPFDMSQTALSIPWSTTMAAYSLIVYAGEVQEPSRTIFYSSMIGGVVYPILWFLLGSTFQSSYGGFIGYYNAVAFAGGSVPFASNLATFAGVLAGSPMLTAFLILTPAFGVIGSLPGQGVGWVARTIHAASMDRFMPAFYARTSKYGSPIAAVWLFSFPISVISAIGSAQGWYIIIGVSYIATWAMVRWWWNLTEIMLPYARPHIYNQSARRPSIGGFPAIVIAGIISGCCNMFLVFSWAKTFTVDSIIANVMIYAIGIVWYAAYSAYNAKKGFDVDKIFTELPPD